MMLFTTRAHSACVQISTHTLNLLDLEFRLLWKRYGVSRLTVRTSSALLLRILVDGKDFVDDAS